MEQNLAGALLAEGALRNLGMAEEWVYVMKRDRDGRISWHAFDPTYQLWQPLPPVPVEYSEALGFGCAVLSGCHLYLFGGKDPLRGSMIQFIVDFKNIVLSEGSTMFKDFNRRLQRDLKKVVDTRVLASEARLGGEVKAQPVEVNVVSHPIQKYAVWFGGSVLASTPEFFAVCHTKAEYEEYGASICRTILFSRGCIDGKTNFSR
ncbi:hypothetical protein L1049_006575 [Liquidambar formosana]|uniref:Uncharacterized protein n=1 Tax=Liquidambar formosana TaxID=63359 RepID=A0AAP0RIM8_LIQFO